MGRGILVTSDQFTCYVYIQIHQINRVIFPLLSWMKGITNRVLWITRRQWWAAINRFVIQSFFEVFIIKYLLMKSFMFNLRLVSTLSNSTLWTCYCMIRHSNVIQAVYRNKCYSGYVPQWMLFRLFPQWMLLRLCPATNAIQAMSRNECYSGHVPQRMLFRLCTAMNVIQAEYRNECCSGCVPQWMLFRLCTAMNVTQAVYRNECYSGYVPQTVHARFESASCVWACEKRATKVCMVQSNPIKHV
jgi:hypothetical protein